MHGGGWSLPAAWNCFWLKNGYCIFLFAGLKCDVGVITFQTSDVRIANPGLKPPLRGGSLDGLICCILYCIDPLHKSMHKKAPLKSFQLLLILFAVHTDLVRLGETLTQSYQLLIRIVIHMPRQKRRFSFCQENANYYEPNVHCIILKCLPYNYTLNQDEPKYVLNWKSFLLGGILKGWTQPRGEGGSAKCGQY